MATELAALVYWGGMLVLFFFWVYGIVSFAFDLKRTILPGIVRYRRGRAKIDDEAAEESERENKEQQLY